MSSYIWLDIFGGNPSKETERFSDSEVADTRVSSYYFWTYFMVKNGLLYTPGLPTTLRNHWAMNQI